MNHRIELPNTSWERLGAFALITGATFAAAISPVAPGWRAALTIATLCAGASQWWRYRRRRPRALLIANDGSLVLERPDGSQVPVAGVRTGVVGPAMLSARLQLTNGQRVDLCVPGRGVTAQEHWMIRRTLLCHRRDESQAGRGR